MKKIAMMLIMSIGCMAYADVITWIGANGATWETASNWSPAQVPTSADDVILDSNVKILVTTAAEANTISMTNGTTLAQTIELDNGATLNVVGDVYAGKSILKCNVDSGASRVIGGNYIMQQAARLTMLQISVAEYGLTINGDLDASGWNTYLTFTLNGSSTFSPVSVGGTITLGENTQLTFNNITDTSNVTNSVLPLVRNSSTNAVVGSFANVTFGETSYTMNGTEYTLYLWDYDHDGYANDIVLANASSFETNTWISSSSGDWNVAANWDAGRVASAIDAALLTNDVIISVSDSQSAASFTMETGDPGTLRVENSGFLTVNGDLNQNGGMVQVSTYIGTLTVGGNYMANRGMSRILQADKDSFTIAGDLTATSDYRFDFAMNSSSVGIGRIVVGGTTTLGGANLTLRSFVPNDMDVILLMHNTSTNDVVGWFDASVPTEYDLGTARNYELKLWDYDEDGYSNDIVLTTLAGTEGYAAWSDDWIVDIGSATNDYDGDGVSNLGEYGLGGNPTNSLDKGYVPSFIQDGENMVYVYAQRTNDAALTYYIETCSNLVTDSWSGTGYSVLGTNTGGTFSFVTNLIPAADPSKFVRLRIENN